MERDAYDDAVEYLTANPERIDDAWWIRGSVRDPRTEAAKCLFRYVTPTGGPELSDGLECGCITQIRGIQRHAYTPGLTAEIRSDERLPKFSLDITPGNLPVFAEWQRRIDRELNRTPPQRIGATP